MKRLLSIGFLCMSFMACNSSNRASNQTNLTNMQTPPVTSTEVDASKNNNPIEVWDGKKIVRTPEEWQKMLTAEQFRILRGQGTERACTGFWKNIRKRACMLAQAANCLYLPPKPNLNPVRAGLAFLSLSMTKT